MHRFIFLIVLSISILSTRPLQAQVNDKSTPNTFNTALLVNILSGDIEDLRVAKRNINSLIRNGLKGKKKNRAENFDSKAALAIMDTKKSRRGLAKLLKNLFNDEIDGSITAKNHRKFIQLAGSASRLSARNDNLVGNMDAFFESNRPVPAANFRGRWNTNFGPIVFAQLQGDKITATYSWSGGGAVRGSVRGNVFKGSYSDDLGSGTFSVIMFDGGQAWSGKYTSSDGRDRGVWSGHR